MSKKMWNKIFKPKASSKTPGIKKKTSLTSPIFSPVSVDNRLSYYEEFHNCCQQQQSPIKETNSNKTTSKNSNSKSQSKFFKVYNTLTLKRNAKENLNNNQLNTALDINTNHENANNYSTKKIPVSAPIIEKICTPTNAKLKEMSDNTKDSDEEPIELQLIPCPTCNRTFVQQVLEKHVKICEKAAIKKRKVFDSSRQRREGTELASYSLPKDYGLPAVKHERGISPKPSQAAPIIFSPKKPPKEPNKTFTTKCSTPITKNSKTSNNLEVTSGSFAVTSKDRSRTVSKRMQLPAAEPCPYCERCFGIKAYDRHVEWCKEKALIASIKNQNSSTQAAAKERLEARIKYRAPCLKTKRAVNRDKYSFQNDDSFDIQASMDENDQPVFSTSSMTSSFMSDSVVSDNYDPFISAKRQLEELCSPSSSGKGKVPPPDSKILDSYVSNTSNQMTTSFSSRGSLTNPRSGITTPKSNFHRTSSLRAPRRSPLPMSSRTIFFPSSQNHRPTIQRGLSDEGPISSNFLKPEEFDEMPVRAVCVNDYAISNTPRVIRRDPGVACNRKTPRLNSLDINQSRESGSKTPSKNNLLKTDSLAIFLKHENESRNTENSVANTKELKEKNNALSKQNSAKSIYSTDDQASIKLNLDISKSSDSLSGNKGNIYGLKLEPIVRPVRDTQKNTDSNKVTQSVLNSTLNRTVDVGYIDPKLINICDNLSMELSNELPSSSSSPPSRQDVGSNNNDAKEIRFIEKNHESSSPNEIKTKEVMLTYSFPRATSPITKSSMSSNRSSCSDTRNQLKRKIRLGRNQFLYDASPETLGNDANDEDNNRSSWDPLEHINSSTADEPSNIAPFSPSAFNEFNFEEFLSAFDNDREQFPSLFKNCREFLMNRTTCNKRSNTKNMMSSNRLPHQTVDNSQKFEQEMESNLNNDENKNRGEIFISIETDQNEHDPHPKFDPLVTSNPTAQVEEVKINDNKFQKIVDYEIEQDRAKDEESDKQLRTRHINLLNDIPNIKLMNATNLIQQIQEDFVNLHTAAKADNNLNEFTNADDISSIESYIGVREENKSGGGDNVTINSKQSTDSAYGSLSRQSPTSAINTHYHTKPVSHFQYSQYASFQTETPHNNSNSNKYSFMYRNLSAGSSSSGSDNSLPPISGRNNISSVLKDRQSQMKELKRTSRRYPLSTSSLNKQQKCSDINNPNYVTNSSSSNNLDPVCASSLKISKFCHECGNKFLLDQAKFCMDCGTL